MNKFVLCTGCGKSYRPNGDIGKLYCIGCGAVVKSVLREAEIDEPAAGVLIETAPVVDPGVEVL